MEANRLPGPRYEVGVPSASPIAAPILDVEVEAVELEIGRPIGRAERRERQRCRNCRAVGVGAVLPADVVGDGNLRLGCAERDVEETSPRGISGRLDFRTGRALMQRRLLCAA